ncbi:MAG: hypothetical protein AAFV93_22520 [Chloroflexota bacterium]
MMKRFLCWWYRVSGKYDEAKEMLVYAMLADADGDEGQGLRYWQDLYGHVWRAYDKELPKGL